MPNIKITFLGTGSGNCISSITQVRDAAKYSSTLWEFQRVTSPI